MNDPQPDLKSIQDNLDEAARILSSLDDSVKVEEKLGKNKNDDCISPRSINSSEVKESKPLSTSVSRVYDQRFFFVTLLSVGIVTILSIIIGINFTRKLSGTELKSLPSYNEKCGSITSQSGELWPVLSPMKPYLGDSTSALLSRIKKEYCGDAFINNEGSLQVATFSTRKQAERFRDQISASLGLAFRIGSPSQTPYLLAVLNPNEYQVQNLLQTFLDLKATALLQNGDTESLAAVARPLLVGRVRDQQAALLRDGLVQKVQASITSIQTVSTTPSRIEVRAQLTYRDQTLNDQGEVVDETPAGNLPVTYILGRDPDGWRLQAYIPG